jgi:putative SOS response-associated peptidase YedK
MCGRVRLSFDVSEIKIAFGIPPSRPTPNFAASWNVALTDPLPVVRYDAKDHQRRLEVMRWGLIPYWAKDEKIGFSTINARAEEADTKPAFREPFRHRRCLVPVENFYEWQKTGKGKQPYAVALKGIGLMALAGLWDTWRSPAEETRPQLHHHHHSAERIVREAPQPDAGGAETGRMAAVARRTARRAGEGQGAAGPLPFG